MSWQRAIEINAQRLLAFIAPLGGLLDCDLAALRRSILNVLRPAEAAARRLIVIAALELGARVSEQARPPQPLPDFGRFKRSGAARPRFRLIDPRKRFDGHAAVRTRRSGPFARITLVGVTARAPEPVATVTPADAANSLKRRIVALKHAVETIPAQARRMARLMARRSVIAGPKGIGPMRPGLPPGLVRSRRRDGVQALLADIHQLALERMAGARPPP